MGSTHTLDLPAEAKRRLSEPAPTPIRRARPCVRLGVPRSRVSYRAVGARGAPPGDARGGGAVSTDARCWSAPYDGLAQAPGRCGASHAWSAAAAGPGHGGHRSHAPPEPVAPGASPLSVPAARAVKEARASRLEYGQHVSPAAFGVYGGGRGAGLVPPVGGGGGGVHHAGGWVWRRGRRAGSGDRPASDLAARAGRAVYPPRCYQPLGGRRHAEPYGGTGTCPGPPLGGAAVAKRHGGGGLGER